MAALEVGQEAFVYAFHHIREDAETLYGFATLDEREVFELLLSAHGVGPALAMAILATHNPTSLARVVAAEDLEQLCLVPGVGKKTAARLMIELKPKLGGYVDAGGSVEVAGETVSVPSALADVQSALAELGYTDGPDAAELLRLALGKLA
jgi:Holliday junction DNA helicase RuvA